MAANEDWSSNKNSRNHRQAKAKEKEATKGKDTNTNGSVQHESVMLIVEAAQVVLIPSTSKSTRFMTGSRRRNTCWPSSRHSRP
jgi:hypothetical protein